MRYGYAGKMLVVDLSKKRLKDIKVTEELARDFLGGYGFGAKVVYDLTKAGVDPMGPGNVIGFTTGALVATGTPCAVRTTVVGKSPLTHSWGDSSCGGNFAEEVKRAGYDAVFVTGASRKPVYLWVHNGKAQIRDASMLWGKDTVDTEDTLRNRLGDPKIEICCIGPGGEKLSRIACPIVDKGNAPGRSGLGAVMGAKKLKAVVARGSMEIPVADPAKLKELSKEARKSLSNAGGLTKYGTCAGTADCIASGDCPTRNWAGGGPVDFPNGKAISDENVIKYQLRRLSCRGCPIACNGLVEVKTGPYAVSKAQKPEYESLGAFGALCLNDNMESIILANDICNRYGVDTISVGCAIAFAMECTENGILTKADADGIDLRWGNPEAVVAMTWKIAKREGIGDLLADGTRAAAKRIGKGSEAFSMDVHGQEVPMHDPKVGAPTSWPGILAITYQADATPGRHTPTLDNRERALRALGLCTFGGWGFIGQSLGAFITACTGLDPTPEELEQIGERIACMRQIFNVREGIKPKDFKLPNRILGKPPIASGPLKGITIDADKLTKEYLKKTMHWSYSTGKPSKARLVKLGGFKKVLADLY